MFGNCFKNFKKFCVKYFFRTQSKGGTILCKSQKVEKVKFFFSESYFFYLNMNYKCSKLSIEVSDMSYNQFLVILRTFL